MTPGSFSPWNRGDQGARPQKRLGTDEAALRLDEAVRVPEIGERVTCLLALRRSLDLTWKLNPDEIADETGSVCTIARNVSALIVEAIASSTAAELEAFGPPLLLEVRILDRRLGDRPSDGGAPGGGDLPDPASFQGAYGTYVAGLSHAEKGEAEEAARLLGEAMDAAGDDPEARVVIARELLPTLHAAGDDAALIARGRPLVQSLSMAETQRFDLGWALHGLARAHEREENWRECVECARESNLQLFGFGASQKCRTIGTNYYLVARGMVELDEWGEAAALAQLSLGSLSFESGYPGRADALVVLARCLEAFEGEKPKADARGILTRLLEDRPPVANAESFYKNVEAKLKALGPGPVSERPGKAANELASKEPGKSA
jgi:hypothetical protein